MKTKQFLLITCIISLISFALNGQNIKLQGHKTEPIRTQDKPFQVETYQLKNGLTVYLNQDNNLNSVLGAIVVKGGAKNDPKNATGIAHYLEHMLFKGSSSIGTVNYQEERIWLDSISQYYDMLPYAEGDPVYRKRLFEKIDYYSQKAYAYAVPGEFGKLISQMGGTNLNAFTDFEKIVYYNEFPDAYMEEWLELYYERFSHAVFRLFQSELETVFEEKNMAQDNIYRNVYEEVYKEFYPSSTYGQQSILGSVKHLKNPSPRQMASYFKEHYVANNMALVLVGDFNSETIKPMIEKIFGQYRQGEQHSLKKESEASFSGRVERKMKLTPVPVGILGFRIPDQFHPDIPAIDLLTLMLSNQQKTGLMDSLVQNNKLMFSLCMPDYHSDISGFFLGFAPKFPLQSLKAGEKHVQAVLEQIREGKISDSYFESIKKLCIQNHQLSNEKANYRLRKIADLFVSDKKWEDYLENHNHLERMNKAQFIQTITKYFSSNYLALHLKRGKKDKIFLQKPHFSKLNHKQNLESEYFSTFSQRLRGKVEPKLLEPDKDYLSTKLNPLTTLYHVKNPYNQVFTYKVNYYIGNYQNNAIDAAASYMNYVGTTEQAYSEFLAKLRKMGTTIQFEANESFLTVSMSGLDMHFEASLQMLNKLLRNPEINGNANKHFIKERKIANIMLRKDDQMQWQALTQYLAFGDKAPLVKQMPLKYARKTSPNALIQAIKNAQEYEADISYVGKLDYNYVLSLIKKHQYISKQPRKGSSPVLKPLQLSKTNVVYTLKNKNAIQSKISIIVPSDKISIEDRHLTKAYNQYFGSGLNSRVFREIREYRALAYSAQAAMSIPYSVSHPAFLYMISSTQSDKSFDAMGTMYWLLDSLPYDEQMEYLPYALQNSINLQLSDFRNRASQLAKWKMQGYSSDPRLDEFQYYGTIKSEMIFSYHDIRIKNRPKRMAVVGKKAIIENKELEKFGQIEKIKLKQIYTK